MIEVFVLLLLILLTALFVMSEIALVSARKGRLEAMAAKGDEKAKAALDLANNPEKFLSTATIGITLISILVGVFAEDKFSKMLIPLPRTTGIRLSSGLPPLSDTSVYPEGLVSTKV